MKKWDVEGHPAKAGCPFFIGSLSENRVDIFFIFN